MPLPVSATAQRCLSAQVRSGATAQRCLSRQRHSDMPHLLQARSRAGTSRQKMYLLRHWPAHIQILPYRWSHSRPEQASHEVESPYPGTICFWTRCGFSITTYVALFSYAHSRCRFLSRLFQVRPVRQGRHSRWQITTIHPLLSHKMCLLISFGKSTLSKNRQLIVYTVAD